MPAALKTKSSKEQYKITPAKFNIVLFIVASSMLFTAFISAYIVHRADAVVKSTWTHFELPVYFTWSAITALVASISIFMAFRAAKRDELIQNRIYIAVTLALGLLFCCFQFMGWQGLVDLNLYFVNSKSEDVSASYVYVISGVHVIHVFGGLVLLTVALVQSFQFKIHKKSMTLMSVTHTYWHFVGLLWIYLFLFLYFAR